MRARPPRIGPAARTALGAALMLSLTLPGAAFGQAVNPGALDALAPARPARLAQPPRTVRPATSATGAPVSPSGPAPGGTAPGAASPAGTPPDRPAPAGQRQVPPRPGQPRTAAARPPAVPTVPPAIAAIPPAVAVPVSRPPDPLPAAVADDAPGAASPVPGGLRVTFGEGRSDLNPITEPALRAFARTVKANEQATVSVVATATGTADDPSTPRRLSLARALAARSVLMAEGIASTRIYVRALGASGPSGPADRVDVVASGPGLVAGEAAAAAPDAAPGPAPAQASRPAPGGAMPAGAVPAGAVPSGAAPRPPR